jgi:phage-related protein
MDFQTFRWPVLAATNGAYKPAILTSQFNDGYDAQAINGPRLQALRSSWPLRVIGSLDYCKSVMQFLEAHMAKRFIWTEPTGRRILVRANEWELQPMGGLAWGVAMTFSFSGVAPKEVSP